MVLLVNVIGVFNLAHQDQHVATGVDRIDRRLVGAALAIATLSGSPFAPMALLKKRLAAAMSRFAVSRKSTVLPCLSMAR